MIRFFNTLTGKIENFEPLKKGEAKIYTCGPTVYDYAHIGNFRAFVFEDLLRRFLEASSFKVIHVMNLTDVDDKTIAGANKESLALDTYTAKYIQAFNEDLKMLNCLAPTMQPRATREIEGPGGMIELIQTLIQKGAAYAAEGSVYYRVEKFPGYGKLSKKKIEMNIAGASERVDADEYDKEQVSDFVLWKKSKEGEPFWDSPWGQGRPGWHIECSSMSMKYLGPQFDLHAGGEDLIFPHHENEIAQSEGATGKAPFVKYWLHCKFLLVNGEKMSKSKGNFYTLRDLLDKGYDPMAVRYALLAAHYRSPLNFTLEGLKDAGEVIKRLDDCYWECLSIREFNLFQSEEDFLKSGGADLKKKLPDLFKGMLEKLSDDLNVAGALAVLHEAVTEINSRKKSLTEPVVQAILAFLAKVDALFGFDVTKIKNIPPDIEKLMFDRNDVRKKVASDKSLWAKSDELRDALSKAGWLVKDGRPGEPSTLKAKRRRWDHAAPNTPQGGGAGKP